jgi:hypothetical protein
MPLPLICFAVAENDGKLSVVPGLMVNRADCNASVQ